MEFDDSEVVLDLGNLLVENLNPIDTKKLKKEKESVFKDIATHGVIKLVNKLNEIPKELVDYIYITKLPVGKTLLPREKRAPKPRLPTRWETYAKTKGIMKKKKPHMIYDEQHEEFRPRFGYKKANSDKDWMLEVKGNNDPFTNPFDKQFEDKKEKIAKNEYQRLGNIAREVKASTSKAAQTLPRTPTPRASIPKANAVPNKAPVAVEKKKFDKEIRNARFATASRGRLLKDGPNEKAHQKKTLKKRKFDAEGDYVNEKKRYLEVFDRIKNRVPIVNAQKAASKEVSREDLERSQEPRKKPRINQIGKKMDKRRKNMGKAKNKGKGKR